MCVQGRGIRAASPHRAASIVRGEIEFGQEDDGEICEGRRPRYSLKAASSVGYTARRSSSSSSSSQPKEQQHQPQQQHKREWNSSSSSSSSSLSCLLSLHTHDSRFIAFFGESSSPAFCFGVVVVVVRLRRIGTTLLLRRANSELRTRNAEEESWAVIYFICAVSFLSPTKPKLTMQRLTSESSVDE